MSQYGKERGNFLGLGLQVSDKNLDDCTVHWGMTEERGSLDGLVWSQQEQNIVRLSLR